MNSHLISAQEIKNLNNSPLFEKLSEVKINTLLMNSRLINLKHRETLFNCGDRTDSFAIVTAGALKLIKSTARGDDIIMYFATVGDPIGALLMNKPTTEYPISVVSMGPSNVLCIPRSTFEKNWATDVDVLQRLNSQLYSRMTNLQDDKLMNKVPLNQKIAKLLINLLLKSNNNNSDETVISVPITRQEIADSLGVTVESVIRTMSDWSQNQIISTFDKKIEILKLDFLLNLIKEV